MDYKDPFKFCVAPLKAETYYGWSHDMVIVLRGKGLRKVVDDNVPRQSVGSPNDPALSPGDESNATTPGNAELSESDEQNSDLALAYIVTGRPEL